jgi:2'-5' RNA ligase
MNNIPFHYFIGMPFPLPVAEEIHKKLVASPDFTFGKYVHPADYHLTLVFLGKAEPEQLDNLAGMIENIAGRTKKIPLHFKDTGVFGDAKRPRIFFAKPEHSEPLFRLREEIKQAAEQAGFSIEKRPFKPHVTIAKKWKQLGPYPGNGEANRLFLLNMKESFDQVVIFRTHLHQSPMYESVHSSLLNEPS